MSFLCALQAFILLLYYIRFWVHTCYLCHQMRVSGYCTHACRIVAFDAHVRIVTLEPRAFYLRVHFLMCTTIILTVVSFKYLTVFYQLETVINYFFNSQKL